MCDKSLNFMLRSFRRTIGESTIDSEEFQSDLLCLINKYNLIDDAGRIALNILMEDCKRSDQRCALLLSRKRRHLKVDGIYWEHGNTSEKIKNLIKVLNSNSCIYKLTLSITNSDNIIPLLNMLKTNTTIGSLTFKLRSAYSYARNIKNTFYDTLIELLKYNNSIVHLSFQDFIYELPDSFMNALGEYLKSESCSLVNLDLHNGSSSDIAIFPIINALRYNKTLTTINIESYLTDIKVLRYLLDALVYNTHIIDVGLNCGYIFMNDIDKYQLIKEITEIINKNIHNKQLMNTPAVISLIKHIVY